MLRRNHLFPRFNPSARLNAQLGASSTGFTSSWARWIVQEKAAVQLHGIHLEGLEQPQRREPGAEIVQRAKDSQAQLMRRMASFTFRISRQMKKMDAVSSARSGRRIWYSGPDIRKPLQKIRCLKCRRESSPRREYTGAPCARRPASRRRPPRTHTDPAGKCRRCDSNTGIKSEG